MTGGTEHGVRPVQPPKRRQPALTTVSKAVAIGALAALLVGVTSSLATARLTDRQSDVDRREAEISALASQLSEQEAEIAQLEGQAGGGEDEVDRLTTAITALGAQVQALEAEKAGLEEQLSQIMNPDPGPIPTARVTVNWITRGAPMSNAIVACLEVENTSDSDAIVYYSYTSFSVVDRDDFVYPPDATNFYGVEAPLMSGQLSPGEKRRGEVHYTVPADSVPAHITWEAGFGDPSKMEIDLPAMLFDYRTGQC